VVACRALPWLRRGTAIRIVSRKDVPRCILARDRIGSIFFRIERCYVACDNDEARSLMLLDVPAGITFRLYDNSDGHTDDDWVEVTTRRFISRKVIIAVCKTVDPARQPSGASGRHAVLRSALNRSALRYNTFERSFTDADLVVTFHRYNGLGGEVSRFAFVS
jgi:hypothetical protein